GRWRQRSPADRRQGRDRRFRRSFPGCNRKERADRRRADRTGNGVRSVSDAVKKKHRAFADTSQAFGVDAAEVERTDYEKYVGLWLHRKRAAIRNADAHRIGILASQSQLDLNWFRAIT